MPHVRLKGGGAEGQGPRHAAPSPAGSAGGGVRLNRSDPDVERRQSGNHCVCSVLFLPSFILRAASQHTLTSEVRCNCLTDMRCTSGASCDLSDYAPTRGTSEVCALRSLRAPAFVVALRGPKGWPTLPVAHGGCGQAPAQASECHGSFWGSMAPSA